MIVSILRNGEWNPSFGGGTDVNPAQGRPPPVQPINRLAGFEDMKVLHTYEFTASGVFRRPSTPGTLMVPGGGSEFVDDYFYWTRNRDVRSTSLI